MKSKHSIPGRQILIQQSIETTPFNRPFEVRVATDCSAYGRLLSTIGEKSAPSGTGRKLRFIADVLTKAAPESRASLGDALVRLKPTRITIKSYYIVNDVY